MLISDNNVSIKSAGVNISGIAIVVISDVSSPEVPVTGAAVTGTWSGDVGGTDTAVTDENGQAKFTSDRTKYVGVPLTFTFTVDSVVKDGWEYDSSNPDNKAFASATYPEAAPALMPPPITALLNAYPNPGNPEIWIPFSLAESEYVTVSIYDAAGHVVRILDLGFRTPGSYLSKSKAAHWDGRNEADEVVTSGIYFIRMQAGDYTAIKKMVISQ